MRLADRLGKNVPYLAMQLRKKINAAKAKGIDVISLAVGDPFEPTPELIIQELIYQAQKPENHHYPDDERGLPAFRNTIANWYSQNYNVKLNADEEVLALIGSKEGCFHFAQAIVNPGDIVLMTDPGYPAYKASICLSGGEPYYVPITEQTDFLPVLEDIPSDVAKKAVAFYLNYPNNPTGAVANRKFFQDVVAFAKEYDIAICHDNAYSEIVFEGTEKLSFLEIEGAKDIGIELNSLSKAFNMTGWRIGVAVGNKELISGMSKVKENVDAGIFYPIQYAAIAALTKCQDNIPKMLKIHSRRKKIVVDTFNSKGWNYTLPKGTIYLWMPTPAGVSSVDFATKIFEEAAVVITPGTAYGEHGEGYFRVSPTLSDERLIEAMKRIEKVL